MVLKNILETVKTATHPVAQALHKTEQSRTLAIAFRTGLSMSDHTTKWPSKLFVLSGTVVYKEGDRQQILHAYDQVDIPVGVVHSVTCTVDALCLLTQG